MTMSKNEKFHNGKQSRRILIIGWKRTVRNDQPTDEMKRTDAEPLTEGSQGGAQ